VLLAKVFSMKTSFDVVRSVLILLPKLVTIYLLDETGKRIYNFINQQSQLPGIHHERFNLPEKLSARIYCVALQTNESCEAVKVMK